MSTARTQYSHSSRSITPRYIRVQSNVLRGMNLRTKVQPARKVRAALPFVWGLLCALLKATLFTATPHSKRSANIQKFDFSHIYLVCVYSNTNIHTHTEDKTKTWTVERIKDAVYTNTYFIAYIQKSWTNKFEYGKKFIFCFSLSFETGFFTGFVANIWVNLYVPFYVCSKQGMRALGDWHIFHFPQKLCKMCLTRRRVLVAYTTKPPPKYIGVSVNGSRVCFCIVQNGGFLLLNIVKNIHENITWNWNNQSNNL